MAGLKAERLLLRRWKPEDRAPFARINSDPVVMEYFPALLSRAESDPEEDFDHPDLPEGHRLKRHVLYRLSRSEWEFGNATEKAGTGP